MQEYSRVLHKQESSDTPRGARRTWFHSDRDAPLTCEQYNLEQPFS